MAKNMVWQDENWLPLLQIYLKKPVGLKPTYCKALVDLSLELHIAPQVLQARMEQIAGLSTPRLERIWQTYSESPRRLARAVRLWREMRTFGNADIFFEGVDVAETFEKDFRPLEEDETMKPLDLILILNLYFQLVPQTMVAETPEVQELSRLIGIKTSRVVEVLLLFQQCDPYLKRNDISFAPLFLPCQQVWQRFNGDAGMTEKAANELVAYYKN